MDEITLTIESEEIHATTRKLKAVWTYEESPPIWSNRSAVEQLSEMLAREIRDEIDREVLRDLQAAGGPRGPIIFQGDSHERYIKQLLGMM